MTAGRWRRRSRWPTPAPGRCRHDPRALIVDDQAVIRVGVARILGPEDGFEVVAECEDGDEVVAAVAEHHPDVVVMDIRMRRLDGVSAIRDLVAAGASPPVLVLTTFDDDDALWGALDAGAAGFVLKDASAEDLIAATRAVANGAAWLDSNVAPRVLDAFRLNVRPGWPRRPGSKRSPSGSRRCSITWPVVRRTSRSGLVCSSARRR